jgi:tRNA-2-methylthio-N6-dimethylallyladenosine synthase
LGQNVNSYRDPEGKLTFAELLAAVGEVPGIRRVRFTTSHPRDFTRDSSRVLKAMAREYTRDWYLERISWVKAARRPISLSTDIIVGFPGETPDEFIETMDLLAEVQYDCVFGFKYSPRPNTPALTMIDSIPDGEKASRLQVLLDRQREIQRINYAKHLGQTMEVMVEGHNPARGQISGRSSQNKPVNFTCHQPIAPAPGSYMQVLITGSHPNSLVGQAVQG